MNDNAMSVAGAAARNAGNIGLPEKLVQDGLLDEASMADAQRAAKDNRQNLVSYLVAKNIVQAREIAIAASQMFGVPLLDLDAVAVDLDTVKLVNDKLLHKHHVMPLMKRGRRLFVALSDPTNLHGIDEIRFSTSLNVEPVVVEEDKLQKILAKTMEQVDTSMPAMAEDDFDLENLEVTGGDEEVDAAIGRDDVEDAPIVRFVNKVMLDAIKKGASDIHFEPYEKLYRVRQRIDGVLKEVARAAGAALAEDLGAHQGHGAARHRRAAHPAGRPHQDAVVEEPLDRLPRQHLPDAVRREDRDAYSRPRERDARASTSLGYEPFQKDLYLKYLKKPQGMILVTGPTGSRQDRLALHRPQHPERRGHATSRRPRTRRKSSCLASTR